MLATEAPFPQYFDTDGDPLDAGMLYFGTSNQNPETSPVPVYWDAAGTQPAAQPVRTLNGYTVRNGTPSLLYVAGDYSLSVRNRRGALVYYAPSSAQFSNDSQFAQILPQLANTVDPALGDALLGVKQPYTGAVARTQHDKNTDFLTVKDFGAIGTANPANEPTDTIAFSMAKAASKRVRVPEGTYYLSGASAGYVIGPGCSLEGAGIGKTVIYYSGAGNGIYMGAPGSIALAYDCALKGITLICTNRASTVNGVYGENLVYFNIEDVTVIGSGSPNSSVPADRVLYGTGVLLTNNSIIGRLSRVSCRLWNIGRLYQTLGGSQSYWTAAIVDGGQGELANNMRGVVVGDATTGFYSGAGVALRDLAIQGNYTTGININAGDNTVVDACYFEGNANYDVIVGTPSGAPTPIAVKIINNRMDSENIGTTPYGTFPYLAKVYVDHGVLTTIENNDLSISSAIPVVILGASADQTRVLKNRLNSGTAATLANRLTDNGTSTVTRDNSPEYATVKVGSITRALDAASGSVAYTGIGFRPTNIEFFAAVDTTVEFSTGIADGNGSRCITSDSAGAKTSSADAIRIIRASAGNEQKAVVATFDADGFTLNWTKVGAPPANTLTINYIARR